MATISSSPTPSPTPSPPAGNSHTAALGVGLSLGVVVICFILSLLYYLHRRRQQTDLRQSREVTAPYLPPSPSIYSNTVQHPFSPGTSYPATSSTQSLLRPFSSQSEPDSAEALRLQLAMLQHEVHHLRASVADAPPQYTAGVVPPATQLHDRPRPRKI